MLDCTPMNALPVLLLLGACGGPPAADTDADTDTGSPLPDEPLVAAGSYEGAVVSIESTCGGLADHFGAGTLDLAWPDDDTFAWSDLDGAVVSCDVDGRGSATCSTFEGVFPYIQEGVLQLDVASELEATSTTSFDLSQTVSVTGCEGFNCDVVQHLLAIPAIPCSVRVDQAFGVASLPGDDVTMTVALTAADGSPLPGVEVSANGQPGFTDADGLASFSVRPNVAVAVEAEAEGYTSLSLSAWSGAEGGTFTRGLWTYEELDALVTSLGGTWDPAKGIVLARAIRVDGAFTFPFGGVTFDLDVPYDLAMAPDVTAVEGYVLGATTIEGQQPNVVFVNVEPGTAHVAYTTPEGYRCEMMFAGPAPEDHPFVVEPGTLTTGSMMCFPE